jgi:hypothetical protein
MEKIMSKIGVPVIYVLSGLALFVPCILYFAGSMSALSSTDVFLQASYILFLLVVIAMLIGSVSAFVTDFQSSVKSLIGLIGILILWGVSYAMSNNEVTKAYEKMNVGAILSQIVESTLILSYLLFVIVAIAIVVTEVKNSLE